MEQESLVEILVIWRGRQLKVKMNLNSNVKEFGLKLVMLTKIKTDTMKLLVPLSTRQGSKLVNPFSSEYSSLSLREAGILEGKPIRMMGVFQDEIEAVSQNDLKPDLRIVGFDEEEKRLRQRLDRPQASLKLPPGTYIFCDFRTLHLPGIELSPPASEALRRMHMLACDPGIIAIMNKHRWRVGVMTEMAPVGYVGISPKCVLGLNKNHGEEISLRLRTDDLKGFRKYESIKKTLLHELAHMVYSEHDADFFTLDKQLNQEAASLDWTKSRSHTLSGQKISKYHEEEFYVEPSYHSSGQKLGGEAFKTNSAGASSVAAAYSRYLDSSSNTMEESQIDMESETKNALHALYQQKSNATAEPDPDDSMVTTECEKEKAEPDPDDAHLISKDDMQVDCLPDNRRSTSARPAKEIRGEPDPDDTSDNRSMFEPDPDDAFDGEVNSFREPAVDDSLVGGAMESCKEPDPDDSGSKRTDADRGKVEPDPDDSATVNMKHLILGKAQEPDPDDCKLGEIILESRGSRGLFPHDSHKSGTLESEPDPDDNMDGSDSQELQRIEESANLICARLQKAIEMLRSEISPTEAISSLQTLFKIVRNVIDHPDEVKFRKLRKANPLFQRNVANYKAAMEVLALVGFCEESEDVVKDEVGRSETFMVLKRNDPGLLWLAKSSLEVLIS